jgi:hypothetical protein
LFTPTTDPAQQGFVIRKIIDDVLVTVHFEASLSETSARLHDWGISVIGSPVADELMMRLNVVPIRTSGASSDDIGGSETPGTGSASPATGVSELTEHG